MPDWTKHVIPTSISLYPRQIALMQNYKEKDHIVSKSAFVREAIDFFTEKFEDLILLSEGKKRVKKKERTDEDFLEENNITIVRRLEY